MAHVYHRAFSESVGEHYRGFLVARIARLYPLHVFVLALFVATAAASQLMTGIATGSLESMPLTGPRSLGAIVANIFMLQGLSAGQLSWNYPAWSISVEFIAYLALPFCATGDRAGPERGQARAGAILFAVLAWLAALTKGDLDQWDGPITLVRCMPEFLLGTLLVLRVPRLRGSVLAEQRPGRSRGPCGHANMLACRRARSADRFAVRRARPFGCEQYRRFRQAREYRTADLARRNLLFAIPDPWVHPVCDSKGLSAFGIQHPLPCPAVSRSPS